MLPEIDSLTGEELKLLQAQVEAELETRRDEGFKRCVKKLVEDIKHIQEAYPNATCRTSFTHIDEWGDLIADEIDLLDIEYVTEMFERNQI